MDDLMITCSVSGSFSDSLLPIRFTGYLDQEPIYDALREMVRDEIKKAKRKAKKKKKGRK